MRERERKNFFLRDKNRILFRQVQKLKIDLFFPLMERDFYLRIRGCCNKFSNKSIRYISFCETNKTKKTFALWLGRDCRSVGQKTCICPGSGRPYETVSDVSDFLSSPGTVCHLHFTDEYKRHLQHDCNKSLLHRKLGKSGLCSDLVHNIMTFFPSSAYVSYEWCHDAHP